MSLNKMVAPLVIAALVVAAGFYLLTQDGGRKTLTAHFPRTVSVYEGSDVRVLGVSVGRVEEVTPRGTDVEVEISYDQETKIPAGAKALIVAPSVVGDRYVQLTPAYTGGDTLADGAVLDTDRTGVPLELDQIYSSLDNLIVALGPQGANKDGALDDLLRQTARNFGGQGAKLNSTIKDVSTLTTTLDDNKDQLFGSAKKLQKVIGTLAQNDQTVRRFAGSLERVSGMLAGERQDLSMSLKNLSRALGKITNFVRDNKQGLSSNIKGLNRIAKLLVKNRDSLEEVLKVAPTTLANLGHTYNPQTGTLDTNANLDKNIDGILSNPGAVLCELARGGTNNSGGAQQICNLVKSLKFRGQVFGQATGAHYHAPHDPTLGGLVEVK